MKVGIHRHIHVCSNCKLGARHHRFGVFAWTNKNARGDFFFYSVGCAIYYSSDFAHVLCRQPIDNYAVCFASTQLEHAFSKCRHQDCWLLLGLNTETKAIDRKCVVLFSDFFTAKCIVHETHNVTNLLVRINKRYAVPFFNNHVARRTNTDCKTSGCGIGHCSNALCNDWCGACVGRHNCSAQTKPWLPCRC